MILAIRIVLFWCAIVGAVALGFSIRRLVWLATMPPILELPFLEESAEFEVVEPGVYTVWHVGPLLTKTPLAKFRPQITNVQTQEVLSLRKILVPTQVNGFGRGRANLFNFRVTKGVYRIDLLPGRSISAVKEISARLLPLKDVALEDYSIQVRERNAPSIIAAILMIIFSGSLIVGGVAVGLLAPRMFL